MRLTTILLAAGLAAVAVPAFAAEEATECDGLAANPGDPSRLGPGVAFDDLDGKAAEAACREALAKAPNVARLQFQLEAANLAAAAVAKVPKEHLDRAAVYDTAAWVEHLRGKDTEALANQAEAAKLSPDYAPFHDRLGDIYAALGRKDEAAAEWRKALALPDPGSGDDGWDRRAINRKLRAPE